MRGNPTFIMEPLWLLFFLLIFLGTQDRSYSEHFEFDKWKNQLKERKTYIVQNIEVKNNIGQYISCASIHTGCSLQKEQL